MPRNSGRGHKRRDNRFVVAIALVFSSAVIWQATYASFSIATSNPSNSWTSGSVSLTATNGSGGSLTGSAVFAATGWRPGDTQSRCITVTYGGNITAGSAVRLYATGVINSAAVNGHSLSSYLQVAVTEGTGATDTSCTGFVAGATLFDSATNSGPTSATVIAGSLMDFSTNHSAWSSGAVSAWTPSTISTAKSFRFVVNFGSSGSNTTDTDLMGMTATSAFTWEVQS